MKKFNLLFPGNYFDTHFVDPDYREEYNIAKLCGFDCYIFDFDKWANKAILIIHPKIENVTFLYRGWMMQKYLYMILVHKFKTAHNIHMLVSPDSYTEMHYFNHAYNNIKDFTPKILIVNPGYFDFSLIKKTFTGFFIMKDNVKSVKGFDFPNKFSVDITEPDFNELIQMFIDLRGSLFTGQIILKQFVDLKKYGNYTNEYRAFYFMNKLLTLTRNSNQSFDAPMPPESLVFPMAKSFTSPFYTIDLAELETGEWIVIETGDGQVSGLSPNQNILEFYSKLYSHLYS